MRKVTVAITLMALLCIGANALANSETSLVMTGVVTGYGPCAIPDPCPGPTVEMNAGDDIAAYLVVRNYTEVAAVQTAFDFGGWDFSFGLWDCQVNQVNGTTPTMPGGATAGTIATAFDCISGGASSVVGRMHMTVGTAGCVTQVESSFPFGNHVVGCTGEVTVVDQACWGSICTGAAGFDACEPCDPGSTPVEPATWGSIKAQYN